MTYTIYIPTYAIYNILYVYTCICISRIYISQVFLTSSTILTRSFIFTKSRASEVKPLPDAASALACHALQCIAVSCNVLQTRVSCVAVCRSQLQCVAVESFICCSVSQRFAMCCSRAYHVLQCVAVSCNV